ncbi:TonB-dependent receptor domain-containing protein [Acinetobacter indicus]|uniref:TonB-dependent receptor n=1 Tax=Acinetobacter indicus TaxID=756892 RepID=A0AAW8Z6U8_9GAMM|nr:TonB-dependent receptor [Acinetobacter indicus]MDV4316622.1 TonB-dependent receptor [Acinetobacter indicus]
MRTFNLRPLSLAILGISASSAFANTTTETTADPTHQLSTIVVSAAGFEQDIKNAPASITVLTAEDLKNKRVNTIADALVDVEGVDISPSAGKTGGLNIRMRGMDSEYTLVLIDGRRQNTVGSITPNGFGESNNSFIPPISAIERIEVIKGPASTLYGSDAMGGVVNIITKKVSPEWTGAVTLEGTIQPNYSEFGNQRSADAFISGPLIQDTLGVQLRARKAERDQSHLTNEEDTNELTQGNNPTKSDLETIGTRLTYTPNDDHAISLEYEQTDQWYDNSKSQLGTLGAAGGYDSAQEYNREKWALIHEWKTDLGQLDSSLTQNKTETVGRLLPARMLPLVNNELTTDYVSRELESEDVVFDTKFSTQYFENHNLVIGGQWWDATITDGLRTNKDVSFDQLGLFVEDTWQFTPSLALTLGARYDDHSTFGDFFTPRAYLVWNANDQWTVKGGYAEGYKAPRLEQLVDGIYNVSGQGATPSFGNPNLKPETSQNLELGFYFDALNGFKANLTGFYSTIDDKIVGGPDEFRCGTSTSSAPLLTNEECNAYLSDRGTPWAIQPDDSWEVSRNVNAEEVELYGVEFGTQWQVNDAVKLAANYTWTQSEITKGEDKGLQLNDTPEHIVNASANWQVADNTNLWARGEYRSEKSRYLGKSNLSGNDKIIQDALGDYKSYSLFHIGANFNITDNWDLGVGLYNVFDKDFTEYVYFPNLTGRGSKYRNKYSNTQEGRRVQLSTTFKF